MQAANRERGAGHLKKPKLSTKWERPFNYHRSRAVYADLNLEGKQRHEQDLLARKMQEAAQQEAA
jgi:hypothetical protein